MSFYLFVRYYSLTSIIAASTSRHFNRPCVWDVEEDDKQVRTGPSQSSHNVILTDGYDRRMYQQRVVTGAIIVVLILLICIIVWFKLLR